MKKTIKLTLTAFAGTIAISSAIATTLSFKPKEENTESFIFDGRIFNSKADVLKYLIQYQKIQIDDIEVLGDLNRSYANSEIGLLNSALLPEFDPNKINFAYFNAGGAITSDYQAAKNTYYNKGREKIHFDDGFGGRFSTEGEAKRSMNKYRMDQNVLFYDQVPFVESVPLLNKKVKAEKVNHRLNPLNNSDFKAYEENIKDHFMDIILDNINYEFDGKEANGSQLQLGYEIEVKNPDTSLKSSNYFDFPSFINYLNPNIEFTNKTSSYGQFHWKQGYASEMTRWTLPWTFVGWTNKYENYKPFTVSTSNSGSIKTLGGMIKNYNSLVSWSGKTLYNLSEDELLNLLNLNYSDKLKWSSNYYKISSLYDKESEFQIALDDIKSTYDENDVANFLDSDSLKIFNNETFKDFYFQLIDQKIDQEIENISSNINSQSTKYSISTRDMPQMPGSFSGSNAKWGRDISYKFAKGYENNVWYKGVSSEYATYSYNTWSNYAYQKSKNTIGNSVLLANLLNSDANSLEVGIKYNNQEIFTTNLFLDSSGNIQFNDFALSSKNSAIFKEAYNVQNLPLEKISLFDFFEQLFKELQDIKNNGNDKYDVKKIMDKYFSDEYIDKYLVDPYFNLGLNDQSTKINIANALNILFTITENTYNKYKENPDLLKIIAYNIPDPNNIIVLNQGMGSNNDTRMTLGKYRLTSIIDFNTRLNEGSFSNSGIATTKVDWDLIRNMGSNDLPAQILIIYDINGDEINVGNYLYDQTVILEYNSKHVLSPRRDYDHVFIEGYSDPVKNEVNIVKRLILNNNTYYFKSFNQLKNYVYNYIDQKMTQL